MTHKNFHHHFLPHHHDPPSHEASEGQVHHRAHALSVGALFVYLQVLVVAAAGIYVIRLSAPAILGTATFGAGEIIDLTNKKRAENNLPPLTYNGQLETAAKAKADNMFLENYWAHFAPSGKTPWSFITASGYKYTYAGENLAREFTGPDAVVDAWMNSPSHRGNILDRNFREIGVAVVDGKLTGREGILVVQMFGASSAPIAAQNSSPPFAEASGGKQLSINEQSTIQNSATVLASREFAISKGITLLLVGFIFLLFLVETVFLAGRGRVHLGGGVLAHLAILGFLLLALWYSVSGTIL